MQLGWLHAFARSKSIPCHHFCIVSRSNSDIVNQHSFGTESRGRRGRRSAALPLPLAAAASQTPRFAAPPRRLCIGSLTFPHPAAAPWEAAAAPSRHAGLGASRPGRGSSAQRCSGSGVRRGARQRHQRRRGQRRQKAGHGARSLRQGRPHGGVLQVRGCRKAGRGLPP